MGGEREFFSLFLACRIHQIRLQLFSHASFPTLHTLYYSLQEMLETARISISELWQADERKLQELRI